MKELLLPLMIAVEFILVLGVLSIALSVFAGAGACIDNDPTSEKFWDKWLYWTLEVMKWTIISAVFVAMVVLCFWGYNRVW